MRQLTQHSLQRLLEPRPQSYFYSCPISSTTSPTFTGSEVNQLPFSTAAEICYSCLTGLYTNNEYYFFYFWNPPGGFISPPLPHYSPALSGGGSPSWGLLLCPQQETHEFSIILGESASEELKDERHKRLWAPEPHARIRIRATC